MASQPMTFNSQPASEMTLENSWEIRAPMHEARYHLGVAVVNGRIYAIGGDTGSGKSDQDGLSLFGAANFSSTNEEYDSINNTWTFKAPMPTPRSLFAVAVYQNKIYCIGGHVAGSSPNSLGGFSNINEVYDPATDTWQTNAPMPTRRYGMAIGVVNGKFCLIGGTEPGVNGEIESDANEAYDPLTDSWTKEIHIPEDVLSPLTASATVDNKMYFVMSKHYFRTNQTQVYDPENDAWSAKSAPPTLQFYPVETAATGVNAPARIYALDSSTNQAYNPETDNWATGAPMITARNCVSVAVLNDTFYVIGGMVGLPSDLSIPANVTPSASNEQYFPIGYSKTGLPSEPSNSAPFPIMPVAVVSIIIIIIIVLGVVVYFKKHKREIKPS